MIAIGTENLLTLSAAARELPRRPALSTLWRWAQRGVRGVRLETVMVGGIRYTSREALQRFAEAVTMASEPAAEKTRTSHKRQCAIMNAETELAKEGI